MLKDAPGLADCRPDYYGYCVPHERNYEECAYRAGQLAMRERAEQELRQRVDGWRELVANKMWSAPDREVLDAHLVEATNMLGALRALEPEEPK